MSVSVIDPVSALVVIDLQKGIVALPTTHPIEGVIGNAARLAAAFRRHRLPVVLVTVDGAAPGRTEQPRRSGQPPADWTELVPELTAQDGDHRVTKRRWGAFHETDLAQHLTDAGVTQIVLTGVATSAGVESTARAAHEHGFHVVFALDAMTDTNAAAHGNSVTHIFPRVGETGSTDEILARLDDRSDSE